MTKKIDFHIHSLSKGGAKDEAFSFSPDWLKEYIKVSKLDAIAITNHNLFSIKNFEEVKKIVPNLVVFPGMEIDLNYNQSKGHVNLIYPNDKKHLEELVNASKHMENFSKIDSLSLDNFFKFFPSYQDAIYIFETGKSKSIKKPEELSNVVSVAGVQSGLKFQKLWNEDNLVVPVLFSDGHATIDGKNKDRSNIDKLKEKGTYVQADNTDFKSIKNALKNKNNVNIYPNLVHDTGTIGGVTVSTGLNLIIGRRGSGKTVFLNKIENENFNNTHRISQFESTKLNAFLEKEQKDRGDKAIDRWEHKNKIQLEAIQAFLNENSSDAKLNVYLKDLKKYAKDSVSSHTKHKVTLFSSSNFDLIDLDWINKKLVQIKEVINSNQLWNYIHDTEEYKKSLVKFYNLILKRYREQYLEREFKRYVNNTIDSVKKYVESITGQTILPAFDFIKFCRKIILENTINQWANSIEYKVIDEQNILGYKIITTITRFRTAKELQNSLGVASNIKVSDALEEYRLGNTVKYLKMLKRKELLDTRRISQALIKRDTQLLTEEGSSASGGQAVALALTLSLDEATEKDIILVDEPEASLDNAFIKNKLIPKLQKLSKDKTVFVVTHNSTLGALLNPDYLIVAKKDSKGNYQLLSGDYSSKQLFDPEGMSYSSFEDFIDAMEAGVGTFNEKKESYDELSNNN